MPGRIIPIVTDEIYHVFNRGINRQPTFTNRWEYQRAMETIRFYRFANPPIRLSMFLRLEDQRRKDILQILEDKDRLVEILCYCFMPNHFHFLVKQKKDNGIAKFLSNFQNSYTRYFNVKHQRDGSLFLDQFKTVRIETDEQLLHVSRYIHLNPYTGYVVKSFAALETYQWSSFPDYIKNTNTFIERNTVLEFFHESNRYKQFVFDQADYQRTVKEIEHLAFE